MKQEQEEKPDFSFCLQSLKHYNEGKLIFKWFNALDYSDYSDIEEEFKAYVKEQTNEDIEEYMFADYSGFPNMGEYPDHEKINEIINFIFNNDYYPKEAIMSFYEHFGQFEGFEDAYNGEYDREEDFAYELIEDCYDLNKMMGSLSSYFDYESFTRDLFMCDYTFINGYVFSNNW